MLEGETVGGKGKQPTRILQKALNCGREAEKTPVTTWRWEKRGDQVGIPCKQKKGGREREKNTSEYKALMSYCGQKNRIEVRNSIFEKLNYWPTKTVLLFVKKKTNTIFYAQQNISRSATNSNAAWYHNITQEVHQFQDVELNQHCFFRGGDSSSSSRKVNHCARVWPERAGNKRCRLLCHSYSKTTATTINKKNVLTKCTILTSR